MRFCVYLGITTLISLVYQNWGHAQVIATNLKQRRMCNLTMSCGSSFIDSMNLTMEAIHTSTHDDSSGTANETSDKITGKVGTK
jgi:hypothetical protein